MPTTDKVKKRAERQRWRESHPEQNKAQKRRSNFRARNKRRVLAGLEAIPEPPKTDLQFWGLEEYRRPVRSEVGKNEKEWGRRCDRHGTPSNCELCDRPLVMGGNKVESACWDHDHQLEHLPKEDQFRGWLCGNCNTGNGLFQDSSDLAYKHYLYLLKHEARRAELLQSKAA